MKKQINQENIKRFSGFSDIYNTNRPIPPSVITEIITRYLGREPKTVVDIGSGTGLSTAIWRGRATQIIGIEPNDDMRKIAEQDSGDITYIKGVSNETSLQSETADIVTVSQAFHWFDIGSTLTEIYRILRKDGVLAIFDCDWPPCIDWAVENAYNELRDKCEAICFSQEKHAVRSDKSSYPARLSEFGKFRFVKDIACHSTEKCTAERMLGIALSQGGIQSAMKVDDTVIKDIKNFAKLVQRRCQGEFEIIFSYRLRVAVK